MLQRSFLPPSWKQKMAAVGSMSPQCKCKCTCVNSLVWFVGDTGCASSEKAEQRYTSAQRSHRAKEWMLKNLSRIKDRLQVNILKLDWQPIKRDEIEKCWSCPVYLQTHHTGENVLNESCAPARAPYLIPRTIILYVDVSEKLGKIYLEFV